MTHTTDTHQTTLTQNLITVSKDIKLSHTIFALPFAILATFLAAKHDNQNPTPTQILLIIICMFFARTAAMTINRWADAKFDATNPRTQNRAIPAGRISRSSMLSFVIGSSILFIIAASLFHFLLNNPYPLYLSPLVLIYLCAYSFFKRFTCLCHIFLGSALALSPLAASIAINPNYLQTPQPYLIALMVLTWVAGFDIIYSLQDVQIDKDSKLHSMPSKLGISTALNISRILHLTAPLTLAYLAYISPNLNLAFNIGIGIVTALLLLEHILIYKSKTKHIHMAFFTLNGIISLLLAILGLIDTYTTTAN